MCFFNYRLVKRLSKTGSQVDTAYMLYVNNLEPISFSNVDDALSYLRDYRSHNVISRLQIYRIETYSL